MPKIAQYPYDQIGLAPGLPEEVEYNSYAGTTAPDTSRTSSSGMSDWMLPAGVAASGLIGYLLLRGRGRRAAQRAAQAMAPEAGATTKNIGNVAEQAGPRLHPLETYAQGRPELASKLYPGSAMGTRAGEIAYRGMENHPEVLMRNLKKNPNFDFLPEGRDPREIIQRLGAIAKESKLP